MCGIIGYIGNGDAVPILINGLKRLEYRGYDSCGVAAKTGKEISVVKVSGKIEKLERSIPSLSANIGIGHTRWATHGVPNEANAHPHTDCAGGIAICHNGIIENYARLKELLISEGHKFKSETDTEVIPHLIEKFYAGNLLAATQKALQLVEGAYAILAIAAKENAIVVARNGSPVVLGIKESELFAASDASAIVEHTNRLMYLNDGEIAVLNDCVRVFNLKNQEIEKEIEEISLGLEEIEKAGYPHFMLKEINEQPDSIKNTLRGRITKDNKAFLGGPEPVKEFLSGMKRIVIVACGTARYAALLGKSYIESIARIPVEVDYASEFRYRNPIVDTETLVVAVSQSGETADTLAAVKEAKRRGAKSFGICNVVGSSIARETDAGIYLHAGPEIGVASTKAFTSQLACLLLFACYLSELHGSKGNCTVLSNLAKAPILVKKTLENSSQVEDIAERFKDYKNFLFIGRGMNYPIALEGALKLKECTYIHAEGYSAAEMKHGPIALIDENIPVVVIAPKDASYVKMMSNIEEIKARKGIVIAIASEGDDEIQGKADYVIRIPACHEFIMPLLSVIPLQLLAYHIAVKRGYNVDQPRNLAKSVTVE